MKFYNNLIKPLITPKPYIFRIIWPILYILMGISFLIILRTEGHVKFYAVLSFIIQLILNLIWPPVFFVFKKIKIAFFILIVLILTVIWMIYEFFKISKISSFLQVPYLLWLFFAGVLNFLFIKLNKSK